MRSWGGDLPYVSTFRVHRIMFELVIVAYVLATSILNNDASGKSWDQL